MASFKPLDELQLMVDLANLRQPRLDDVIAELQKVQEDVVAILQGTVTLIDMRHYEYHRNNHVRALEAEIRARLEHEEADNLDYESHLGTRLKLQAIMCSLDHDFTGTIQWMWNKFSIYFEGICALDTIARKGQYTEKQVQKYLQRGHSGAEKALERCERDMDEFIKGDGGWMFQTDSVQFIDGIGYMGKDKSKRQKDVVDAWRRARAADCAFKGVKKVFKFMKERDEPKLNI
jgi:hypothetical protein